MAVLLACFVVLLTPSVAHAVYIDPGTGALLMQLLLAGFFGAAVWGRRSMKWFKARVLRRPVEQPDSEEPEA